MPQTRSIRVAVLEDHPVVIQGYKSYLSHENDIEIVASAAFGEELEPMLVEFAPIDVLILDVNVPTSPENRASYPILHLLPKLMQRYPRLLALVISMHKQSALIKAVMDAGASGFVLKDDRVALEELGYVIRTVAGGGIYLSQEAHEQFVRRLAGDSQLSVRQAEVLSLCAAYPNDTLSDIANRMALANTTVRNILSAAYLRLGVRSRTAAVAKAQEQGLLPPIDTFVVPSENL